MSKPISTMITMKELALTADVSIATISRFLSHPEKLSKRMQQRVESAMNSYGYSPRNIPSSNRTKIILAICSNLNSPIYDAILSELSKTAKQLSCSLLKVDIETAEEATPLFESVAITNQLSGIIYLGSSLGEQETLSSIPHVYIGSSIDISPQERVDSDYLTSAFKAVSHFNELGHHRIACILNHSEEMICHHQEKGYKQALQRFGIALDPHYLYFTNRLDEGEKKAVDYFMSLPTPPSAIYCHHDLIAMKVIHQLKQLGFSVPDQISVMGFGDDPISAYYDPPLTTVSLSEKTVAEIALKRILQSLPATHYSSYQFNQIQHDNSVIIRNSTAAPPNHLLKNIPSEDKFILS